jgi:hypothetical protein
MPGTVFTLTLLPCGARISRIRLGPRYIAQTHKAHTSPLELNFASASLSFIFVSSANARHHMRIRRGHSKNETGALSAVSF